jgi:hypothetical protein
MAGEQVNPINVDEFPVPPKNSLFRQRNSLFLVKKFPVPPGSGNWGASL